MPDYNEITGALLKIIMADNDIADDIENLFFEDPDMPDSDSAMGVIIAEYLATQVDYKKMAYVLRDYFYDLAASRSGY